MSETSADPTPVSSPPSLPPAQDRAIARAAQALRDGALVAFPTETVYGLGARADDDAAVAGIYAAKGRPSGHPLIVHVTDAQAAEHFSDAIGATARRLMQAWWPGPLTLIVPRRPGVAAASAGGQDTIGLRCPAHPVAQQLLAAARDLGVPGVSAPSANRFGRVSPTRADHVRAEFGPDLMVLDGGDCEIGIESTIVDCTREPPALLRPGGVGRDEIEAWLGVPLRGQEADSPRASGTLESHYAPRAAVRLIDPADWSAAVQAAPAGLRSGVAVYSRHAAAVPGFAATRQMPADVTAVAHELYAVLRELDADGVTQIWVERPPTGSAWDGVNDRLRRAAAA